VVVQNGDTPAALSTATVNNWRNLSTTSANTMLRPTTALLRDLLLNTWTDVPFFSQIRWRCRKVNVDRVVDLAIDVGRDVVDFFTGQTNDLPSNVGRVLSLPEDTSLLGQKLPQWNYNTGTFGDGLSATRVEPRMSHVPMFVAAAHHWFTGENWQKRYECDDFSTNSFSMGDYWDIYVRSGPCDSNPCENGGTCTPASGSTFTCACVPPYLGATCSGMYYVCLCSSWARRPFFLKRKSNRGEVPVR
jgi:hypothetical protein